MHTIPRLPRGHRTARTAFPAASRWLAAAVVVPTLGILSACSGSGDGSDNSDNSSADGAYCSALADAKPDFAVLQEGDLARFDDAFAGLHELAGEAPSSLIGDWKAFDGALRDLETALADIGLKVSDLAAVTEGEVPPGADTGDLAKVPDLLLDLVSEDVSTAATNIEQHALEECDIELAA